MITLLQPSRFLVLISSHRFDAAHRASAVLKKCYSINHFCCDAVA